ncbi:hypothetical protein [Frankia sp. CiP3]|uniref:hypothetical protein n=1 Tax=Frankia sp. CiP3 TaxID=2880971 RepID=UPI001EF725D8|nr:hypothetical protein [Frankia sp. CiP3]
MPGLVWEEVKDLFDPNLMGALPDVFVPDASVADWQALFHLVQARNWQWQYSEGSTDLPLPSAAAVLARPADREIAELRVWPQPGVLAIFRIMSADEIDFDVDLRELQGQLGVDALCSLLAEIGRELGKPVMMTAEGGSQAHPVLGFDPTLDRVVTLADPSLA